MAATAAALTPLELHPAFPLLPQRAALLLQWPASMDRVRELVHSLRNSRRRHVQLMAAKQLTQLLQAQPVFSTAPGEQPQLADPGVHWDFLAAGGMQAALHLLCRVEQVGKVTAANLMYAACVVPEAATQLAADGGVQPLVQLLECTAADGASGIRRAALCTLALAAEQCDTVQDAAVAAGCVPLLVAILQEPNDSDHVANAAAVLSALVLRPGVHTEVLLTSGAAAALVRHVPDESCVCEISLTALSRLTGEPSPLRSEAVAAVAAAGGIPAAVQCLNGTSSALNWPSSEELAWTVPQLAAGLLANMRFAHS